MGNSNFFMLYQLNNGNVTRDHRFEPLERLASKRLSVEKSNYRHIYTGLLEDGATLDGIYEQFNAYRPADFTGHSLSVSDVVVLGRSGKYAAHYVNDFGFAEVPVFLNEPYMYFSTQRPVDIGTIPKTEHPSFRIVNFEKREWVENASFRAWGYLTYGMPLTQKQMDDFELRAASDNPDLAQISPYQKEAQIQVIGAWEKAINMPERKRFTWWHGDYGVFALNNYVRDEMIAERFMQATSKGEN